MLTFAFAGFRHAHVFDLYQRVIDHPDLKLVATCEEDPDHSLMPARGLAADFTSLTKLLAESDFDVLVLGDCYGKRGAAAIAALEAGRHVLADKPLCTAMEQLDRIEALAGAGRLSVGLMLDLRDNGNWIALREVVRSGRLGEIQTVSVSGQHPLLPGSRPGWYFEPGMHGGTLNDIAIHAVDFIPWITGSKIAKIVAARSWTAKAAPPFRDCAQMMAQLDNGAGVLGDFSYLAPDACGYTTANYWRVTVHGTSGFAETSFNASEVTVADDRSKTPELIPTPPGRPGGYLLDFLDELRGTPGPERLSTGSNLRASRWALELEAHAQFTNPA